MPRLFTLLTLILLAGGISACDVPQQNQTTTTTTRQEPSRADPVSGLAWAGAIGCGLISTALLMVNNIRDIPTDREVGKMTLAARLGDGPARASYGVMLAVALLLPLFWVAVHPGLLLVPIGGLLAIRPIRTVLRAQDRRALIPVLRATGVIGIVYAITFTLGALL